LGRPILSGGWQRRIICIALPQSLLWALWFINQVASVPLVPGSDTTVLVGPLRDDGSIDYVRALDDNHSAGVTPQNNAAVRLLDAIGPEKISASIRTEYFQRLGIPVPPVNGNYLRSIQQVIGSDGELARNVDLQRESAEKRPWTSNDFPVLEQWVTANAKPLEIVAEACRLPKFFVPSISVENENLSGVLLSLHGETLPIVRILAVRSTLRLGEGHINAAIDDCETLLRLGFLASSSPFRISQFTSYSIVSTSIAQLDVLVQSGLLTVEQARRIRKFSETVAGIPELDQIMSTGERYAYLELVLNDPFASVQMNEALREANRAFTEIAQTYKLEDFPAAKLAVAKLHGRATVRLRDSVSNLIRQVASPRVEIGREAGLKVVFKSLTAREHESQCSIYFRSVVRQLQLKILCGLAEYRAIHGEFPAALGDLVPEYLDIVPLDPFSETGDRLKYTASPKRDKFLLYSVGRNAIDEHGHTDLLQHNLESKDDIALGEPSPE
jgi:hypothetical protein